ncbi:hypothetical protein EEB14_46175 [Rhodococcus sp. WS4]|nr:hypothetical protein EEB14_46175 [Rhodococcus sp. WS4]
MQASIGAGAERFVKMPAARAAGERVTDSGDFHREVTVGVARAAYGGSAVAAVLLGGGAVAVSSVAWGVAVEVLAVVVVLVTVVLIVSAVYLLLCAVILVEQRRLGRPAPPRTPYLHGFPD